MANFTNLIAAIKAVIKQNGTNDITGQLMQDTLTTIVGTIGRFATFAGVAVPSTNPNNPDQTVFYLATQVGTYVNFGGLQISGTRICAIHNISGAWSLEVIITLTDGTSVEIDPALDANSLNPVENRAVYAECQAIRALISQSALNIHELLTSNTDAVDGMTFANKIILSFTARMQGSGDTLDYISATQSGARLELIYANVDTHSVSYEHLDGSTKFTTLLGQMSLVGNIHAYYIDEPS